MEQRMPYWALGSGTADAVLGAGEWGMGNGEWGVGSGVVTNNQ